MYHYVGNTSLAGAYAMLCSTESERKVYDLATNMTYIELSTIPQYMDEFVGACFLPHTDASLFPESVKFKSNVCETEDKCGIKGEFYAGKIRKR